MSDATDAVLAAGGDYQAFERLYSKYLSRVYSLCVRLSGNLSKAEELTEEVFVKAWEMLSEFAGESPFAPWLHRLATDLVVNDGGADAVATATIEKGGERLELSQAIDTLPADTRRVFVLHDVEGYRHEEIAEILGTTVGASKAQLRRARVLLKEALGR
jgi:RNA polymerase sigma-70 factor (ECF subfamily)